MGKSKLATCFMLIGLIGLVMSCGHIEQIDHDDPVKPLPKVTDMAMVDRLKNTNSPFWNHSSRVEIVNN